MAQSPWYVASETDALGATRYFDYNDFGNLSRFTDRNGKIRQFGYDASGNVASETWYANGDDAGAQENVVNTIEIERDDAGRITSENDNLSSVIYVYNDAGQITSTTQSSVGGPTVTLDYQYDSAGHRTQMAATIDGVADFVDDYSYDSLGRVVSVIEHGRGLSQFSGGLSQVSSDETGTVPFNAVALKEIDIAYNDADQIVSIDRYENGQLAVEGDYWYDANGRLTALVYHQGETVLNSYQWTYSGDGVASLIPNPQSLIPAYWSPTGGLMPVHDTSGVTDALMCGGLAGLDLLTSITSNDGTANYRYDPTGQLVGATYTGGQDSEAYTYDLNGNRTNARYVTGPDNRLLSDGTYCYAYDTEGNRTARFIDVNADGLLDAGDTDITQYAWDNRNRLVEVVNRAVFGGDPTQIVDYLYDVENRWIGQSIGSNGDGQIDRQIRFAYDGNQIVLQFEENFSPPLQPGEGQGKGVTGADLSHRYLWQPDAVDQLLADEHVSAGVATLNPEPGTLNPSSVVWPLADNLGTVRDLATTEDGTTSVANHRVYDSFGNLKSRTSAAVDCLFGFTGRPLDGKTSLQNNLNRWYDSKVGRWMSKDPIGFLGRDANQYRYVGNSPINAADTSGLAPPDAAFGRRPPDPNRGTLKWADLVIHRWLDDAKRLPKDRYWNISAKDLRLATQIRQNAGWFHVALDWVLNPAYTGQAQLDQALGALGSTMPEIPPSPTVVKGLPPPVDRSHSR